MKGRQTMENRFKKHKSWPRTFFVVLLLASVLIGMLTVVPEEVRGASVPSAPQNLQATAGEGYVYLDWEAPSDDGGSTITEYKIYRGTGTSWTYLASTRQFGVYSPILHRMILVPPATSYNDTDFTSYTTYYYKVSAVNEAGEGAFSNQVSARPTPTPSRPSAPQTLVATAGDGYVNLSWNPPSSNGGAPITNYRIYRGTTSGGEVLLTTIGNVRTYNDINVISDQTYFYKVSAVNSAGEGSQSNEVHVTTPTPTPSPTPTPTPSPSPSPSPAPTPSPTPTLTPSLTPSAPQNLRAAAGDGYIDLSWSAPSDVGGSAITEYRIYRGTSSGNEGPLAFVSATTTSYNDTAVTNNQTYYYTVSAVNAAAGEGAKSEEASDKPTSAVAPSPWKWLVPVLIIIAAIVVAIAAIFIYKKKKKGKKQESFGRS
jgi:fibronectin type 3 domain-containing protein